MDDISIPVEPLTEAAFQPHGWLLAASDTPSFSRPGLDLWRKPFVSNAPTRLQIMRYHRQPMRFRRLERHIAVTEARFPVAGARAVLIVAGETSTLSPEDTPQKEAVRAFLLDGSVGVMFRPGIWHGLDCYPVDADFADFLFLSDEATETEIESQVEPFSGERTHVAAYPETFCVADPQGLL